MINQLYFLVNVITKLRFISQTSLHKHCHTYSYIVQLSWPEIYINPSYFPHRDITFFCKVCASFYFSLRLMRLSLQTEWLPCFEFLHKPWVRTKWFGLWTDFLTFGCKSWRKRKVFNRHYLYWVVKELRTFCLSLEEALSEWCPLSKCSSVQCQADIFTSTASGL